jgi:hypothetical protein
MDVTPDDNSISFNWTVTDTVFAKENGFARNVFPLASNWPNGAPFAWTYGNHYYITNGDEHFARSANFIIATPNAANVPGIVLNINLWEWNAPVDEWMANPGQGDYSCNSGSGNRSLIGGTTYEILGTEPLNGFVNVPLVDYVTFNDKGVPLKNNTHYVLMIEYTDSQGRGNVFGLGANDDIDFTPTIFVTQETGLPRMAGMLGLSNNLENEPFSWVGFGLDLVPCVRLNVVHESLIPNATVDILDNAKVNIFPSPASDDITIDVELAKSYSNASIKVIDVKGATMIVQQYNELQNQRLTFNVANWVNGTYFLHVQTAEGVKTQHFVVQH